MKTITGWAAGLAAVAVVAVTSTYATAAPITLEGMGVTSQWTDLESTSGEMPLKPWGNSDVKNADRVGIFVEYSNGLTGSATYSGVSGYWGGCCNVGGSGTGIAPDTETGFFASTEPLYANLHGLDNSGPGFPLPMAWWELSNAFAGNFDLSYENQNNSTWRADAPGWGSVQITLYSSAATREAPTSIPEPGSLALLGAAFGAFGLSRRRQSK